MSADVPQTTEVLAIAFLVEASLALSYEWRKLLQDYIGQLLQRCKDVPGSKATRMAFVTYGTADTIPSPIVKKVFFTDIRFIMQHIRENFKDLGIGQTNSGSDTGMAALEGFAAILDMYDMFRNIGPKDIDFRVIHVAASPPDPSEHPLWNSSPTLDSLSWETLPIELKKRNVQLTGINTVPDLPRFPGLYAQAATTAPTPPWFNIHKPHFIFLNWFSSIQTQAKATKRAGDNLSVEGTPETKRQKTTPTTNAADTSAAVPLARSSPKPQPTIATSPPSIPLVNPAQPPQPSASVPPAIRAAQPLQFFILKKNQLEGEFKMLLEKRQMAMAQKNMELANELAQQMTRCRDQFTKLSQAYTALVQQQQQQQQQAMARRQSAGAQPMPPVQILGQKGQDMSGGAANVTGPSIARPAASPSNNMSNDAPAVSAAVAPTIGPSTLPPPRMHARSVSTSNMPTLSGVGLSNPANSFASQLMTGANARPMSSDVAAQMQKLIEQQNRSRPLTGNSMSTLTGQTAGSSAAEGSNPTLPPPMNVPQQLPTNPEQPQSIFVWEGVLCWNGTGSDGNRKEIQTHVSASLANPNNNGHPHTWPSSLTLIPTQQPVVSNAELQDWIRRTKPVLCTFKARTSEDEANYRMLVHVMTTKHRYATASWTLPNGVMEKNVLIFPVNNMVLCGAFFPLTGIPEMPKSQHPYPPQVPQAILSFIAQLPADQRQRALVQLRQRMMSGGVGGGGEGPNSSLLQMLAAQRQQQQNAQSAQNRAISTPFGLNPGLAPVGSMPGNATNLNANLMNMMNTNALTGAANNSLGNSAGVVRTASGNGGAGDLSYDVMQSFMRRNHSDGNSNPGMGPTSFS